MAARTLAVLGISLKIGLVVFLELIFEEKPSTKAGRGIIVQKVLSRTAS